MRTEARMNQVPAVSLVQTPSMVGAPVAFFRRGWLVNARWDLIWMLSPLVALPLLYIPYALHADWFPDRLYFVTVLLLAGTHWVSPILTAWTLPGMRAVMVQQPARYLLLPAIFFFVPVLVGLWGGLMRAKFPGYGQLLHPTTLL